MCTENGEDIREIMSRIVRLDRELCAAHPGIMLRWARIYGTRWAHLLGEVHELTAIPLKLQINQEYGLIIENPEILSAKDVESIVDLLKGEFGNEVHGLGCGSYIEQR